MPGIWYWIATAQPPIMTQGRAVGLSVGTGDFDRFLFHCRANLGYNHRMTAKLTKELAAALHATGDSELEVVDPETERTYFLVDSDTHRQAMEALRRQQDRDAIAQGIAEMEAGDGISVEDAHKLTRESLLAREQ